MPRGPSNGVARPLIGVTARSAVNPDTGAAMDGAVEAYLKALLRAGAAPVLVPRRLPPEALSGVFLKLDGLLLPGGGDIAPARLGGESHPAVYGIDDERDELEFTLVRWAAEQAKPILGICRGIQVFNAALGGRLYLDIPSQRPTSVRHDTASDLPGSHLAHRVNVEPGSRLATLFGSAEGPVNSWHHQAVCDAAPGLWVTARAEDGLIEAVELPAHPFALAVQWHPEMLPDRPETQRLFAGLVAAAQTEADRFA
jgi:putative glutamine amidotransferase